METWWFVAAWFVAFALYMLWGSKETFTATQKKAQSLARNVVAATKKTVVGAVKTTAGTAAAKVVKVTLPKSDDEILDRAGTILKSMAAQKQRAQKSLVPDRLPVARAPATRQLEDTIRTAQKAVVTTSIQPRPAAVAATAQATKATRAAVRATNASSATTTSRATARAARASVMAARASAQQAPPTTRRVAATANASAQTAGRAATRAAQSTTQALRDRKTTTFRKASTAVMDAQAASKKAVRDARRVVRATPKTNTPARGAAQAALAATKATACTVAQCKRLLGIA